MTNFDTFLRWESSTRDTMDFKKAYVDMAGDVVAGLVLSEIVFWHLPNKQGQSKLRVQKDQKLWIAIRRYDWWDRVRITPRQSDRAIAILKECGLVETDIFKFYGEPTVHIHLIQDAFLTAWEKVSYSQTMNPFSPKRENEITKTDKTKSPKPANPVTEITSEKTTSLKVPLGIENRIFLGLSITGEWEFSETEIKRVVEKAFPFKVSWSRQRPKSGGFIPQDFLDMAREENITPVMIEQAAQVWKADPRFNWQIGSLDKVWEKWPALCEAVAELESKKTSKVVVK